MYTYIKNSRQAGSMLSSADVDHWYRTTIACPFCSGSNMLCILLQGDCIKEILIYFNSFYSSASILLSEITKGHLMSGRMQRATQQSFLCSVMLAAYLLYAKAKVFSLLPDVCAPRCLQWTQRIYLLYLPGKTCKTHRNNERNGGRGMPNTEKIRKKNTAYRANHRNTTGLAHAFCTKYIKEKREKGTRPSEQPHRHKMIGEKQAKSQITTHHWLRLQSGCTTNTLFSHLAWYNSSHQDINLVLMLQPSSHWPHAGEQTEVQRSEPLQSSRSNDKSWKVMVWRSFQHDCLQTCGLYCFPHVFMLPSTVTSCGSEPIFHSLLDRSINHSWCISPLQLFYTDVTETCHGKW